jgi:two-component sensor histidine kinase
MHEAREREDGGTTTTSGDPVPATLGPAELAAIVACWAFLALVAAASRLLDPRVPMQPEITRALVTLSAAEYALWAVLTIPIVLAASRIDLADRRHRGRLVVFVLAGLVVAVAVDVAVAALRAELLPLPPRGRFGRRIFGLGPRGDFGDRGGMLGPVARSIVRLGFFDDLMVYLAILSAGIARGYFHRDRARRGETVRLQAQTARLQVQLARARLEALRAQLDPHFLFNTLNAVSALVKSDPRGVRRMIARLSELLRQTLEGPDLQEVPLARELELLRLYVEIMEVRFQGRLDVRIEVADELRDALVPTLVLQPLVENAVKHGVSRVEEGRIVVRGWREEGETVLRVEDDGPGVDGDAPTAADTPDDHTGEHAPAYGGGVGLRNTRERLAQLYGAAARLTLERGTTGGTVAELRLPWRTTSDAASTR